MEYQDKPKTNGGIHYDREKTEPSPLSAFHNTVRLIQEGRANELPLLQQDCSIMQLRNIDTSLPRIFFDKTTTFIDALISQAHSEDISIEEKITYLNNLFYSQVSPESSGGSDFNNTPIDLQILRLSALLFVGFTTEFKREKDGVDPKTVETPEITTKLQDFGQLLLSDYERSIINALATGIEIGYQDGADDQFHSFLDRIKSLVELREEKPGQLGDDFLEAILTTNF